MKWHCLIILLCVFLNVSSCFEYDHGCYGKHTLTSKCTSQLPTQLTKKITSRLPNTTKTLESMHFFRQSDLHQRNPAYLHISAFNIEVFGPRKLHNRTIMSEILYIIGRYDVILVQEVFNSLTITGLKQYLREWSKCSKSGEDLFGVLHSPPLGKALEYYVYIYRKDRVKVLDSNLYSGPYASAFSRPPFSILFEPIDKKGSKLKDTSKFSIIGLHAKPKNAEGELSHLGHVYQHIRSLWKDSKTLIMGDLNADRPYLNLKSSKADGSVVELDVGDISIDDNLIPTPPASPAIKSVTQNEQPDASSSASSPTISIFDATLFRWLIETGMDTTFNPKRPATLDRIIVHKDHMDVIVPNSARPFYYPIHNPPYFDGKLKLGKRKLQLFANSIFPTRLSHPTFEPHLRDKLWHHHHLINSRQLYHHSPQGHLQANYNSHAVPRLSMEMVGKISDHFPVEVVVFAKMPNHQVKKKSSIFGFLKYMALRR